MSKGKGEGDWPRLNKTPLMYNNKANKIKQQDGVEEASIVKIIDKTRRKKCK